MRDYENRRAQATKSKKANKPEAQQTIQEKIEFNNPTNTSYIEGSYLKDIKAYEKMEIEYKYCENCSKVESVIQHIIQSHTIPPECKRVSLRELLRDILKTHLMTDFESNVFAQTLRKVTMDYSRMPEGVTRSFAHIPKFANFSESTIMLYLHLSFIAFSVKRMLCEYQAQAILTKLTYTIIPNFEEAYNYWDGLYQPLEHSFNFADFAMMNKVYSSTSESLRRPIDYNSLVDLTLELADNNIAVKKEHTGTPSRVPVQQPAKQNVVNVPENLENVQAQPHKKSLTPTTMTSILPDEEEREIQSELNPSHNWDLMGAYQSGPHSMPTPDLQYYEDLGNTGKMMDEMGQNVPFPFKTQGHEMSFHACGMQKSDLSYYVASQAQNQVMASYAIEEEYKDHNNVDQLFDGHRRDQIIHNHNEYGYDLDFWGNH